METKNAARSSLQPLGMRRLEMSYELLREMLLCQRVNAGERVYSNLPCDLVIVAVALANVHQDFFTIYAKSSEWPPVTLGGDVPVFEAVFHRERTGS